MAKGSDLVAKMQSFCVSVTNKNLKGKRIEQKANKGSGLISKLFGTNDERKNTQNKNSMSQQEMLEKQAKDLREQQEEQFNDYTNKVRSKAQFREDYCHQLGAIIDSLEKGNQHNTEIVETFISDFSSIQESALYEI